MRNSFLLALTALPCVSFSVEPGFAASPGETYMRDCAVCHLPGIAGAPKVGDNSNGANAFERV